MTHSAAPFVQTSTPSDSPPTPLTPPNFPASPAPGDSPPTPPTSPDAHPALRERYQLGRVSDDALHARVKTLVGRHNVLTADILAHLAEVDARGIYRERACSSLYAYCVYELRFSEDEAQRRSQAARTARKFPTLFEMLAQGAIHMTGLLLLAPHLTTENCTELLARARFRTKREIERLVAEVAPRADVPARIEALGPSGKAITNLWTAYTASLRGRVRELESGTARGQAPAPVFDESGQPAMSELDEVGHGGVPEKSPAPARNETPFRMTDSEPIVPLRYRIEFTVGQGYVDQLEEARNLLQHQIPNRDVARIHELAMAMFVERLRKRRGASGVARRVESERIASGEGGNEQRIFEGSERERIEERSVAEGFALERIGELSMAERPAPERIEELSMAEGSAPERIEELSMAEGSAPERIGEAFEGDESAPGWISEQPLSAPGWIRRASVTEGFVPERIGQASKPNGFAPERIGKVMPSERSALQRINDSSQTGDAAAEPSSEPSPSERSRPAPMKEQSLSEQSAPARRGTTNRHIPVLMRRHVWARDGGRCTFSDENGRRCHERSGLEVHHELAFALGGSTTVENLRLLCRAHNTLFAERDFGREHIERMRNRGQPK